MRVVASERIGHQQYDDSWDRHDEFGQSREHCVKRAAEVAGDQAEDDADDDGDDDRLEDSDQGYLTAIEQPAEHVATQLIGAEWMRAGGSGEDSRVVLCQGVVWCDEFRQRDRDDHQHKEDCRCEAEGTAKELPHYAESADHDARAFGLRIVLTTSITTLTTTTMIVK